MPSENNKIVLFAILHWGLGHAARSIPLIRALQSKGYKVIVCTDGKIIEFLQNELGNLIIEEIPAYNIHYSHDSMAINMLIQLPKIYKTFRKEYRFFQNLIEKHSPSFCISDNRYGCRSNRIPSYFLGHQWNILNGKGEIHFFASRVNQYLIKKFDGIIIPDNVDHEFSGSLSKGVPKKMSRFSGILSRFTRMNYYTDVKKYDLCIILSGPEPSRTKMEHQLIDLFSRELTQNIVLIRGTNKPLEKYIPEHLKVFNLVNSARLSDFISSSSCVISRSGYSSIMDYVRLGVNKMIYIPTSGQTEQEYLARYYEEKYKIPFLPEDQLERLPKVIENLDRINMVEGISNSLGELIESIELQMLDKFYQ